MANSTPTLRIGFAYELTMDMKGFMVSETGQLVEHVLRKDSKVIITKCERALRNEANTSAKEREDDYIYMIRSDIDLSHTYDRIEQVGRIVHAVAQYGIRHEALSPGTSKDSPSPSLYDTDDVVCVRDGYTFEFRFRTEMMKLAKGDLIRIQEAAKSRNKSLRPPTQTKDAYYFSFYKCERKRVTELMSWNCFNGVPHYMLRPARR